RSASITSGKRSASPAAARRRVEPLLSTEHCHVDQHKGRRSRRPFCLRNFCGGAVHHCFTKQNRWNRRYRGTSASPFRCRARAMKTPEENSMTNRFMMSVAAAALIAGAGFANAQGTGTKEQPSGSSAQQQNAPSSERGSSSGMKATQSEEKSPGAAKNQRAEDKAQGQKSKSSENEGAKAGKDMKAEGKSGKD